MRQLGNGLSDGKHDEEALSVRETELSLLRRIGAPRVPEDAMLCAQNNLAVSYQLIGLLEQALSLRRDVYLGRLKLNGEEHLETLRAANNYAKCLVDLKRFEEAKVLMRNAIPVARRVLGESHDLIKMRINYATALYMDDGATVDDLREALTTLEDTGRIARRVLGGAYPITIGVEGELRNVRAALRAREEVARPAPGTRDG